VDDECVHPASLRSSPASPRPGPRRLRAGELVKLDVTAELKGYYADACVTVPVGRTRRWSSPPEIEHV
jgi:methionine aminopeptidase